MKKYVRAKKYLRIAVPALIVLGAILVPKVDHAPKGETLGATKQPQSVIQVSDTGGQAYTNVTADSLQPAAAPSNSATSSGLSPQQAMPNYCAPGEQPIVDGCVSK